MRSAARGRILLRRTPDANSAAHANRIADRERLSTPNLSGESHETLRPYRVATEPTTTADAAFGQQKRLAEDVYPRTTTIPTARKSSSESPREGPKKWTGRTWRWIMTTTSPMRTRGTNASGPRIAFAGAETVLTRFPAGSHSGPARFRRSPTETEGVPSVASCFPPLRPDEAVVDYAIAIRSAFSARRRATISSCRFAGTCLYRENSMLNVPFPCVIERSSLA
jgi:hypothetical protein